jgi:hypothetical protein
VVRRRRRKVTVVGVTLRYEIRLSGRPPQAATGLIDSRFGTPIVYSDPPATVLVGTVADQAAVRALLTLLWDANIGVLSVAINPTRSKPTDKPPTASC